MRVSIPRLADKLLTAVLPQDDAAAGCPPDCQTFYECDNYHHLYTTRCCYRGDCSYYCSALQYTGNSC